MQQTILYVISLLLAFLVGIQIGKIRKESHEKRDTKRVDEIERRVTALEKSKYNNATFSYWTKYSDKKSNKKRTPKGS